jgi:predicted outer membrane repeat protein
MNGKLARTAAGAIAAGAITAAGLCAAPPALAGAAATDVPCSVTVLAADVSSASSGETLSLAAGCVYDLTAGLPVISQDLTIDGNAATLQRSDATGTPAFVILQADGGALTISKLNFRNGNGAISVTGLTSLTVNGGTFTANTATYGGAIDDIPLGDMDGPEVNDVTFTANTASEYGGAIFTATNGDGTEVNGGTFTGNTASTGDGGAIYDSVGGDGTEVNGGTFTGNTAPAGDGGAIYDNAGGDGVEVTSGTFTANTAAAGCGGAIFDFDAESDGVAGSFYGNKAGSGGALCLNPQFGTSFSGVVSGNSATQDGGGIDTVAPLDVSDSTFSGNHAGAAGGGLWTSAGGGEPNGVAADGTSFSGNSAADGGGIFNSAISLDLNNDSIYDNQASAHGGGLYNEGPNNSGEDFSPAALVSTVISGNRATTGGGGIYNTDDGIVTLTTSPVVNNEPDNCEPAGSITGCTNVGHGPTGPIVSGDHTTTCIADAGDATANDTKIVLAPCDGSAGQNWTVAADGTIGINGKCMDIYRDEKTSKAPIELWTCTGGANQQWQAIGSTLVNPASGKCLDDPRFSAAEGTQLEIYTCTGGLNQQWQLP